MAIEQIWIGLKQKDGTIKPVDWYKPVDYLHVYDTNIPADDDDETKSIRRYWRWKGCKRWQDNFYDAIDDYSRLQRKNKLIATRKHSFEIDDKLNVLKKAVKGHSC